MGTDTQRILGTGTHTAMEGAVSNMGHHEGLTHHTGLDVGAALGMPLGSSPTLRPWACRQDALRQDWQQMAVPTEPSREPGAGCSRRQTGPAPLRGLGA